MDNAQENDRAAAEADDAYAKLEAAFRNSGLKIDSDNAEARVQWAVNVLACLWVLQPSPALSLPQFKKVGRKVASKELHDLAVAAKALIARLEALSATAISALGGPHIMNPIARQTAYLRDLAAVAREAEKELDDLAVAREADVKNVAEVTERGRPENRRAIFAATVIVDAFEGITGCDADKPANISIKHYHDKPRGLEPLARKIFNVIGIAANAKAAVNAALNARRRQGQQNPSGEGALGRRTTSEEFFEGTRLKELDERSPKFWRRHKNTSPNDH